MTAVLPLPAQSGPRLSKYSAHAGTPGLAAQPDALRFEKGLGLVRIACCAHDPSIPCRPADHWSLTLNVRFISLLVPIAIAAFGLVTGASWLSRPTPGWPAMPLGNLCTWLAFLALALMVLDQAHRKERLLLRHWARVLLVLAVAWAPLGYLASGNWQFSFSGDNTWLDLGLGPGLHSWLLLSAALAGVLLCSAALSLALPRKPGKPVPNTL